MILLPSLVFVAGAIAAGPVRMKIDVDAKRSRDNVTSQTRSETVFFTVTIKSLDFTKDHNGLKATLCAYAKDVDSKKKYQMVRVESFEFDLPKGKSYVHEDIEPVMLSYDNKLTARYGYKYNGWVVVVKDAAGTVVAQEVSYKSFLKYIDKIVTFGEDYVFNRSMRVLSKPEPEPERRKRRKNE